MAGAGIIGTGHLTDKWATRKVFGKVWEAAVEGSTLIDPRICPTVPMTKIRGVIPLLGNGAVQSQLDEFEHATSINAIPAGADITLYKDRVRLAVSDEAKMDSDVGDPLQFQKMQASAELAGNLDSLIATQIFTTPQLYGGAVTWSTASPLIALGSMISTLRPYRATAVVMSNTAFAAYVSALGDQVYSGGSQADLEKGVTMLPGYNIPVFSSTHANDASSNGFAVISAQCPGVLLGTGAIKIRTEDNMDLGAEIWQGDYWRTPISNLRQTSGSLNLGVIVGVHS